MCQYFSCIVTRDLKVHWSKTSVDHESLINELKLEDKKLEHRDFVRIEIVPNDSTKMTRNPKDWHFKIDEEGTLPEWFVENREKAKKACWVAWEESVQVQLALGEEEKEVTGTLIYVREKAKVVARGSSTVEARDSSTVVARDSSTVVAWDSSTVEAWDSSTVVARDSSTVEAWESSHVVAWESSHVKIKSSSVTVLCDGKIFVSNEAVVVKSSEVKAGEV